MTLQRVINVNEVSINGDIYATTGQVISTPSSQYASPVRFGAITGDSQQRLSQVRWSTARGGIGKKDFQAAADTSRLWYGTGWLRVDGHRTLPSRVTTTAASGVSGVFKIGAIAELANAIYASFGLSIRTLDFNTDSWGTEKHELAALATDALTARLNGTVYMIFFYGTGYVYYIDGGSFTNQTTNVQYGAVWDDRLWGIDSTGQLRWTFDPTAAWTDDAKLPLPDDYVQDLFVGRDAIGNHILYASTKVGLFAHDVDNNRFVQTEVDRPFHDNAGAGVTRFRDATYIPQGLGITKYAIGSGGAVITTVGPDKDQGLPANRRGVIVQLLDTYNDLIALVDSTSAASLSIETFPSAGFPAHASPAFNTATGVSMVLAWDEVGWQVMYESTGAEQSIDYGIVSNAYSGYRLWFAQNELVRYISLPPDIVNPSELSDREYADSSRDEFSWFDGGQAEVDKLGVRLHVEVAGASSTETVTPYIGTDFDDDTWTALGAISSDGIHTYHLLPVASLSGRVAGITTSATGLEFRALRYRDDMANGTNNRVSPDVRSVTLEYRKKLPFRLQFSVEIDLNNESHGRSAKQQRADLLTAYESNSAIEFTYRDDTGDTRNYYVDIVSPQISEFTGYDERGRVRLIASQL